MRILIADDNKDNRDPLALYFRLYTNWEVSLAENGAEAIAMFESAVRLKVPFDCVVLDIAMPDISGLMVAKHIREAGSSVPIVFFTAYDRALNRQGAEDVGAAAYLVKPLDGAGLHEALGKVLSEQN